MQQATSEAKNQWKLVQNQNENNKMILMTMRKHCAINNAPMWSNEVTALRTIGAEQMAAFQATGPESAIGAMD